MKREIFLPCPVCFLLAAAAEETLVVAPWPGLAAVVGPAAAAVFDLDLVAPSLSRA